MRLGHRLGFLLSSSNIYRAFSLSKSQPRALYRLHRPASRLYSGGRLWMSTKTDPTTSTDQSLRVALCQCPVTDDKATNFQTIEKYLEEAAGEGAQLVVLPEIWNSPYATAAFPEYAERLPHVGESDDQSESESASLLRKLAKKHSIWLVGGSIPEEEDGEIFNTCLVFDPKGNIVAKHRKVHLFDIDVPGGITFFESDTLSPGNSLSSFPTPWGNIGVGICYDIRFPEYAMLLAKEHQCGILIYPGAFNLTTGPAHWELLQRARAVDNQCFVVTASPARTEEPASPGKYPHYTAWGHSTVVSPWGEVIATRDEKEGIVVAELDIKTVQQTRMAIPISEQKRQDLYRLSGEQESSKG